MKYIIVTGGVISGLGKGITASSIGLLLQLSGYTVTALKIDPYLNIDAGTMSPFEHGECYVLKDGSETDLDLGNYERFLRIELTNHNTITTGKVYQEVLKEEREGKYLGKTVQVIPHITNKIKEMIYRVSGYDFCIIELGGTIGDIESLPFVEALRDIDSFIVHVSLIPFISTTNEEKTKPTQHSIRTLMSLGMIPNVICLRSENPLITSIKKLYNFCKVPIISNPNYNTIYEVPIAFEKQNIHKIILNHYNLSIKKSVNLQYYSSLNNHLALSPKKTIAIVGKYTGLKDSYLSLIRALERASYYSGVPIKIKWCEKVEEIVDGVIIPGGFGQRGIANMIKSCKYAREHEIPFLGICLGLHILVLDIAKNICGIEDASSEEFGGTNFVISKISNSSEMGGTLELGEKEIQLKNNSWAYKCYKKKIILERFRHRYHINKKFLQQLESGNLLCTGFCNDNTSIMEYSNHFCIGVQYHPEFEQTPFFIEFLKKCL